MSQDDFPSGGVFASLRRLCVTGLTLLQNRLELFGVEVDEQKARLLRVLFLGAIVIVFINAALLSITVTTVMMVGKDSQIAALIGLSLLYAGAAGGVFLLLRKELRSTPPAFNDTVSELKKDREWLDSQN